MTPASFRKLALSLPDTEERSHMNHPDFRVKGKIFATLAYPTKEYGMVKLHPEQQQNFVDANPEAFQPVKGAWGRQGSTSVLLAKANEAQLRDALHAAWQGAQTPKKRKKLPS